ncbi:transporter substrate-binding domain-containing protein [Teredinibacter sp. KSP-S5-2]|uniref:substrate-binding periplasmic protein n=1 Tax=Teredinibacter sp. KSP-S5-2 TaxID=3034506 RepID=UPI0029347743|nr:transporter substrate-binding domain-containing protein [Teredinibacter sp. KSP-S5-2]WNO09513.1 transporter substrate-binding domain-containing protein [Teredinibacter sp. KSP-S5-2]
MWNSAKLKKIGLFLTFFCQSSVIFAVEQLKIASIDWCPQLCSSGEQEGYVKDIVKLIFKDSPYQVQITDYPWSRSILLVRNGDAHALLSPAKAEAPSLLYPQHEVGTQRMCFFTHGRSSWQYTGVSSLNNQQIGIATDTSVEELNAFIANNKRQFQFMPYTGTYVQKSVRKLIQGRMDAFLFTRNTTLYELSKLKAQDQIREAGCVSEANIYMAFSPDNKQREKIEKMMVFFDLKMRELKARGEIEKIMQNYGL